MSDYHKKSTPSIARHKRGGWCCKYVRQDGCATCIGGRMLSSWMEGFLTCGSSLLKRSIRADLSWFLRSML
jgi:hypothetical protein